MTTFVQREDHPGGIVEIRLDRPPANALNTELVTAIADLLEDAVAGGAGAIVLSGRPGMFCGGLDVPELLAVPPDGILRFWQRFFALNRALAGCAVPVVAAITGHAPAGGAVLALHCDVRIAAAGNWRIGLNEVQVGLPVPPTILTALAEVVGPTAARRLAVRGQLLAMAEAQASGLVDELVEADQVVSRAVAAAGELLALPPVAMNTTRRNLKISLLTELGRADDAAAATRWWFSPETQEGMQRLAARLGR